MSKSNAERQAAYRKRRAAELDALRNGVSSEPLRNEPEPEPLRNEPEPEPLRNEADDDDSREGMTPDEFKKAMYAKMPKAFQARSNGLPSFIGMEFLKFLTQTITKAENLEKRHGEAIERFLHHLLFLAQKTVTANLDDMLPDHIKAKKEELIRRESELIRRENDLLRNEVKIPPSMLCNGWTKTEIKKLRGSLHPDKRTAMSDSELSEQFAVFNRVMND